MKIALCGSLTFHKQMRVLEKKLRQLGHVVLTPKGISMIEKEGYVKSKTIKERIAAEAKYDFIRGHLRKVEEADAILVANYDKNGVKNYVGGNTFLEVGYAYYLRKPIYFLNPVPEMIYTLELAAMKPIILNGDLTKLQ
jgi:nucleoside 2-deoxyribosyltransferase